MDVYSFERIGVSPALERTIKEFGKHGMEIIPVDRIGPSERMRPLVDIAPNDPVICFYMGGSPVNKSLPYANRLVHDLVLNLARVESQYPKFPLKLLNGGGNEKSPYENTGLMGLCTKAMHEGGQLVRCAITEKLIIKEGLLNVPGKTICLIHYPGETRLGTRIDILNGMANKINTLFGGLGSLAETVTSMTETSINGKSTGRTLIIPNPIVKDWGQGKGKGRRKVRYYEHMFSQILVDYGCGQVTEAAIKNLNNRVVLYNPAEDASCEDMVADMVSLNLSSFEVDRALLGEDHLEVPVDLSNKSCRKLSAGSTVEKPFAMFGTNGDWAKALRERVGAVGRKRVQRGPSC